MSGHSWLDSQCFCDSLHQQFRTAQALGIDIYESNLHISELGKEENISNKPACENHASRTDQRDFHVVFTRYDCPQMSRKVCQSQAY